MSVNDVFCLMGLWHTPIFKLYFLFCNKQIILRLNTGTFKFSWLKSHLNSSVSKEKKNYTGTIFILFNMKRLFFSFLFYFLFFYNRKLEAICLNLESFLFKYKLNELMFDFFCKSFYEFCFYVFISLNSHDGFTINI